MTITTQSLKTIVKTRYESLTKKGRALAEFVLANPGKAVFMTTRELAAAVGASEATVVRFVRNLGYDSYALFIRHLREHIDTGMTLVERQRLAAAQDPDTSNPLTRTVLQEIENLRALCASVDIDNAQRIIQALDSAEDLYVIGSRLSYAPAFYMGWILAKVRTQVYTLKGSDSTCLDTLATARKQSVVVMIATSRYPNELLRIGKYVKRLGMSLILLTDSTSCPVLSFSDLHLIAPYQNIPFLGTPTSLCCLISYLVHTLAKVRGDALKPLQEKLEQAFLENDLLFNLETRFDR
ncbi:MAG: MurR/RpiR family transcriptional regulator [Pseudomonadota bacterium]